LASPLRRPCKPSPGEILVSQTVKGLVAIVGFGSQYVAIVFFVIRAG
jgi:hypothetical protein